MYAHADVHVLVHVSVHASAHVHDHVRFMIMSAFIVHMQVHSMFTFKFFLHVKIHVYNVAKMQARDAVFMSHLQTYFWSLFTTYRHGYVSLCVSHQVKKSDHAVCLCPRIRQFTAL
jgi:hypothetical protein